MLRSPEGQNTLMLMTWNRSQEYFLWIGNFFLDDTFYKGRGNTSTFNL